MIGKAHDNRISPNIQGDDTAYGLVQQYRFVLFPFVLFYFVH